MYNQGDLGGHELAQLLATLPPSAIAEVRGLNAADAAALRALDMGGLTIEQALAANLTPALLVARDLHRAQTREELLCNSVASVPAVAAPVELGW